MRKNYVHTLSQPVEQAPRFMTGVSADRRHPALVRIGYVSSRKKAFVILLLTLSHFIRIGKMSACTFPFRAIQVGALQDTHNSVNVS